MKREQITFFEEEQTLDLESTDLFDDLTTGGPVTSENLKVIDLDSGKKVWLWKGERGTMVIADDDRTEFVEGGTLAMTTREPEREVFPTGTSSTLLRHERQVPRFINLRPLPSPGLARIMARAPEELRRVLEWQKEHGNPLEHLDDLLGNILADLGVTWEEWYAIIDEPYEPYEAANE